MHAQAHTVAAKRPYKVTTDLMTQKMPLTTVREVRSSFFPASNHAYAPGTHVEHSAPEAMKPVNVVFGDGSYVTVSGKRVERHRRVLDFIFSQAPAIHVGGFEHVFFIDLREAARVIYGDAAYYVRLADLIRSMSDIKLTYYSADGTLDPDLPKREQPLQTNFEVDYQPGENMILDDLVKHSPYMLEDMVGKAQVRISGVYIKHLASNLKLSYHPALPHIFKMGPVAAQLTRFALSNKYLRSKPLRDLLELIGAPTGAAQDRAIKELRTGADARLLAELGILIREHGSRRQLVVDYEAGATGRTLSVTQK